MKLLASAARRCSAGDVLVLVRQRGPLFEAIIRALKDAGVPVAGADRLMLTEHIAVMDLMALADALLLPDDDLALATRAEEPAVRLDEEQLFALAWDRKGSLARRACARKPATIRLRGSECGARRACAACARHETPFAFYRACARAGARARKRFLARLGPEATDALDEFLDLALDYERAKRRPCKAFVAWLRAAQSEVKRDMEIARDEVRVMTVHGAKGLEAPTVILADTDDAAEGLAAAAAAARRRRAPARAGLGGPQGRRRRRRRRRAQRGARCAAQRRIPPAALCGDDARGRPAGRLRRARRKQAARRLLVRPRARRAEADCVSEPADDGDGEVLRFRKTPACRETRAAPQPPQPAPPSHFPTWLRRNAPRPSAAPLRRSRRRTHDDDGTARRAPADARTALLRGSLMHRLMQSLPGHGADIRAAGRA